MFDPPRGAVAGPSPSAAARDRRGDAAAGAGGRSAPASRAPAATADAAADRPVGADGRRRAASTRRRTTAGVEADARSTADDLPTGARELDLGRAALEAGDPTRPRVRLGLVLRLAPALAPAVLDLVGGRTEPGLALVRGDAYRLVGREIEAAGPTPTPPRRPATAPTGRRRSTEPPPDADPTPPTADPTTPTRPTRPEGDPA